MSQEVAPQVPSFADLGLHPDILAQLTALGYEQPTPIQAQAIPALIEGRDVLGQAATGTGKTAAFGLPLIQSLAKTKNGNNPAALILTPTRELAIQVGEALKTFAPRGIRVVPVYGGQPIGNQLRALRMGVDVIVATPGRLLDHMERRSINLSTVQTVVLDEADEMLDMGFAEDLDAILGALPENRQTALFSATLPPRVAKIANSHLNEPVHVQVSATANTSGKKPNIQQLGYFVQHKHKPAALERILILEAPASSIVFCRTRADVDVLTAKLTQSGQRCEALHGGLSQEQRDRVMARYRDNHINLLIATDVAARGLDIDHVSHVFNYDLPDAAEVYVHRIGRTGRAGRDGVAISFITPRERRFVQQVERRTQAPVRMCELPTLEQLLEKRMEQARGKLREALASPAVEAWHDKAEALLTEFSPQQIASLALMLTHDSLPRYDAKTFIPGNHQQRDNGPQRDRGPRQGGERPGERPLQRNRARATQSSNGWPTTRLFVNTGRNAGIRPGDLVGAIANELDLDSRAIGSIQIQHSFSLVEVPEEIADDIVAGMRGATIRGKRVNIRRDQDGERAHD